MEGTFISLKIEDSILKNKNDMREHIVALDRYVSQHPDLSETDFTFRTLRQKVKKLQLEQKTLLEMERDFRNTLLKSPLRYGSDYKESYTKSRNDNVVRERLGNKIGERQHMKISKG